MGLVPGDPPEEGAVPEIPLRPVEGLDGVERAIAALWAEASERGAVLRFHDPHVAVLPPMRHYTVHAQPARLDSQTLRESDFTIIVTHHDGIDWDLVVRHAPLVIDTRNATRGVKEGREKILRA